MCTMSDNILLWTILLVPFFVGECLTTEIHKRLALVWAEKNVSLQDVWNNTSYGVLTTDNLTITQPRQGQNLRSGIIDNWMNNVPTSVSMVFYNTQEDVLAYWNFSVIGSNSSLSSWLTESRIQSSSFVSATFQNVKLQQTREHFELFLSNSIELNSAWFGATSNTATMLSNAFPVFLISKSFSTAYPLQTESSTSSSLTYVGCWQYTTLSTTQALKDVQHMTVEKCVAECSTSGKPLVLLHLKVECHCGKFVNTGVSRNDPLCVGYCPGNNKQICGFTPGMFAVYKTEDITIKAPTVPVPVIRLHSQYVVVNSAKLTIDLSSHQPADNSPVYVTALSATTVQKLDLEFRLEYRVEEQWLTYTDWNGNFVTFQAEVMNNLTVLPVNAIGLVFLSNLETVLPFKLQVNIFSIGDENFIQAPLLAIEAHWLPVVSSSVNDDTTTPSSLTLAAIDDTTTAVNPTTVELSVFSTETGATTETTPTISNDESSVPSVVPTDAVQSTSFTASDSTSVPNSIVGTTSATPTNISTISSVIGNRSCVSLNGSACECSCSCHTWFNTTMSTEELAQKIKELRALLLLNKKQLSSYMNKLISADDKRPSAQQIGGCGAAVLVTVVSLIVAGDFLTLMRSYLNRP